ncbi:MAG: DNA adenine methylase [Pseudomonadota bacterium]|nr:DNA adenine methylase [Pseudomonadota bacterium]
MLALPSSRTDVYSEADEILAGMIDAYRRDGNPVRTDFRNIVDLRYNTERATHLIHTYPAKLIVHIPNFFLSCRSLIAPRGTVADPFCGSGTVLLEAALKGYELIGADSNPLARLITLAKLTVADVDTLNHAIIAVASAKSNPVPSELPDVVNRDYWYSQNIQHELSSIWNAIQPFRNTSAFPLLQITFSQCSRKVSRADPKFSVPVRLKPEKYARNPALYKKAEKHEQWLSSVSCYDAYTNILRENTRRHEDLARMLPRKPRITYLGKEARKLGAEFAVRPWKRGVKKNSVDLILTSPPYAGAQKYIRASSLNIGWLGLAPSTRLRELEDGCIGREHFKKSDVSANLATGLDEADIVLTRLRGKSPLRAHLMATYLLEMRDALTELSRALKRDGYAILVLGNNKVCAEAFDTVRFTTTLAEQVGFSTVLHIVDEIKSRGLMTRRNKNSGIIETESVVVLKNSAGAQNE